MLGFGLNFFPFTFYSGVFSFQKNQLCMYSFLVKWTSKNCYFLTTFILSGNSCSILHFFYHTSWESYQFSDFCDTKKSALLIKNLNIWSWISYELSPRVQVLLKVCGVESVLHPGMGLLASLLCKTSSLANTFIYGLRSSEDNTVQKYIEREHVKKFF